MRKLALILLASLASLSAYGQALSFIPPPMGAFYSLGGTGALGSWQPFMGTGGVNPLSFVPPSQGLYYSSDGSGNAGTWYPCTATCFGSSGGSGTVNSGTAYSPAYYPATGTAVSGTTPFNGIGYFSTTAAPVAATAANVESTLGATGITGTGNLVYSASPVLTGTVTGTASINISGSVSAGSSLYGKVVQNPTTTLTGTTPGLNGNNGVNYIVLSGNTTPVANSEITGGWISFIICQPATGGPYTWTWPAAYHGGGTIGTTASTCSDQMFYSTNATDYMAMGSMVTGVPVP